MRKFVICNSSGTVVREYTGQEPPDIAPDQTMHEVALGSVDSFSLYWGGDKFLPIPPRPDGFYTFDTSIAKWVPDITAASEAAVATRNHLLVASDWSALPDVPMTPEKRSEWAAYRQALRDITDQPGYPLEVVWPVQPE